MLWVEIVIVDCKTWQPWSSRCRCYLRVYMSLSLTVSGGSGPSQQYPGKGRIPSSLHQLLCSDLLCPHAGNH